MEDNKSLEQLRTALAELSCINRIIDKIARVRETNHLMTIIIDEVVKLTEADQGVINLVTRTGSDDLMTVVRKDQAAHEGLPYKVHNLVSGWVLRNKRTMKVDDLDNDDRLVGVSSENGRFKSLLCCPLQARGEIIGLLSLVKSADKGSFNDDQTRLVSIVASQSAQILSNALLLEELAQKNELLEVSQKKLRSENDRLRNEVGATFAFENIVGKSEAMKQVMTLASKVSVNDSPVLIIGPTGTGKELIARAIHFNSPRKDKPFVVKNCGVKTETLLESELFGHVKGAFTGADRNKSGLFREADGGTIFLDEIGEAPLSTQVAILRVLENGEIRPIGASGTEFVNVRIVSATNRDLEGAIESGQFRRDLYYRLNTFTIDLPPLRNRHGDIPLLVHHFLKHIAIKVNREALTLTPAALDVLSRYSWPGNVRQLEHELERAAVVCDSENQIDLCDLSPELLGSTAADIDTTGYTGRLREVVERVERDLVVSTLSQTGGNILKTSKILGLTRKGLKDKMARYGIAAKKDE
jgi:Nif-specific regulatory protein